MNLIQSETEANSIFNQMIEETIGKRKPHDPTAITLKAECFAHIDYVVKTGNFITPSLNGKVEASHFGDGDITVLAVSRADFNRDGAYVWSISEIDTPTTTLIYVSNWMAPVATVFKTGKTAQLLTKVVDGKYSLPKFHRFDTVAQPVDFFSLAW